MFRKLYDRLAAELADPGCMFLNYGYHDPAAAPLDLRHQDHKHRYHLNLVHKVLGYTELSGRQVLEIGSGRGGNCLYLTDYTGAAVVVGLDLSMGNLQLCRRNRALARVRFVRGNAERLPFGRASFDTVLSLESSHCYQDLAAFLAEVKRVLRPGGVLCFADLWNLNALHSDWQERAQAVNGSGLTAQVMEDISEPVFAALHQPDSFSARLQAMASPDNQELVNAFISSCEAVKLHLAAGQCEYRLLRLQKPTACR
jgi:ubiquinone/menaquinone biosynthesis C-methylase UbiE